MNQEAQSKAQPSEARRAHLGLGRSTPQAPDAAAPVPARAETGSNDRSDQLANREFDPGPPAPLPVQASRVCAALPSVRDGVDAMAGLSLLNLVRERQSASPTRREPRVALASSCPSLRTTADAAHRLPGSHSRRATGLAMEDHRHGRAHERGDAQRAQDVRHSRRERPTCVTMAIQAHLRRMPRLLYSSLRGYALVPFR